MKVAIGIDTGDWNRIIKTLVEEGWTMCHKYENYDAGIDFDFLILSKNNRQIIFGWSNWEEGEIKCSDELFRELSKKFGIEFRYGPPSNLKQSVILLNLTQTYVRQLGKAMEKILRS